MAGCLEERAGMKNLSLIDDINTLILYVASEREK